MGKTQVSTATENDLAQYLDQKLGDLEELCQSAREQNLADFAGRGLSQSGPAMVAGAKALEEVLTEYISARISEAPQWVGDNLRIEVVRASFASHLREALSRFCVAEFAYRTGTRSVPNSAAGALEGLVRKSARKLESSIRAFELGVGEKKLDAPVYNVVQAETVIGGIQQSAGSASQTNNVTIDAKLLTSATAKLLAALDDEKVRKEIGPDLATLESQLAKAEPSASIVREAGKSIRSIVEGAFGGAVGSAMTPQLAHALAVFTAILGL
jgi:hypothetical protein